MNIGINATAAFIEPRTGVEEYTEQLIRHLTMLKESEKHRFLLYSPFNKNFDFELPDNFEIIHQTGERNFNQVRKEAKVVVSDYSEKYYHIVSFLNEKELADVYQVADLIISRAGAGTIFEIAANGKPSILVPITKSAQNHQLRNAYVYSENKAALVMEETNFTPRFLLERLKYLFSNPEKLKQMSEKAKEFSKPEAAKIIAEYIVGYLTQE